MGSRHGTEASAVVGITQVGRSSRWKAELLVVLMLGGGSIIPLLLHLAKSIGEVASGVSTATLTGMLSYRSVTPELLLLIMLRSIRLPGIGMATVVYTRG